MASQDTPYVYRWEHGRSSGTRSDGQRARTATVRETPGYEISSAKHNHKCSGCQAVVLLGQVKNASGTLKWRNFEAKPIQRGAHNFYRRHFCPKPPG